MTVLRLVGISPRLLMLGFMIPTALLSMWIRLLKVFGDSLQVAG